MPMIPLLLITLAEALADWLAPPLARPAAPSPIAALRRDVRRVRHALNRHVPAARAA
jgi:hypothetical protein